MSEFAFGAADLIEHLKKHSKLSVERLPRTALMCLSPSIAAQLSKVHGWRVESALGAKWSFASDSLVIASGFGMGAPSCVAKLEEMACLGVKRVLFVGTAGSLQPNLKAGDIVVGERAISAEGTSRHYSVDQEFHSSVPLTKDVMQILRQKKISFQAGSVWTTDAPYRERKNTLLALQNSGVLVVDMEASAIYAAAQSLSIAATGIFVISDEISEAHWRPHFGKSELRDKFMKLMIELTLDLSARKPR
jgi:purine-nucleoside phosphorylase